ncbi:MAG: hypothetical protein DI606_04395 [Sphingobium sp.]|uniref:hypothetical protein n=1 Tax=Sphingobium sp. TaxID=1912891 RepID=UPI000DB47D44|nr:hypothetical protein [Sphingobium sp.]PZU13811.1 MAG: hypothetical protein DI606_04395 [Sphingobium sp.]
MGTPRNRTPVPASALSEQSAPADAQAVVDQSSASSPDGPEVAKAEIPAAQPPAEDSVEGRVLRAFEHYLPNDIDSWSVDDAEALEKGGFIDTHAKAVAYAKSLIEG